MKVSDLRSRMVELGLSSKGNRSTLLERLAESYLTGSLPCANCRALEERVKILEERLTALAEQVPVLTRNIPVEKKKKQKKKKAQRTKGLKKKVLLLSDSQGRHCAGLLQEELGSDYQVSGLVKPGAPLREVLRDCSQLARDVDVLVIQAGTNDLSPRGGVDIAPLRQQLARLPSSTRVILSGVPPRFDRPHLNTMAMKYNEAFKTIDGVSNFNPFTNLNRSHYTRHGLHLNFRGKRDYVKLLAAQCSV